MFAAVMKSGMCGRVRAKLCLDDRVAKPVGLRLSRRGLSRDSLGDLDFFKRSTVENNAIEWGNGDDCAPECPLSPPEA